MLTSYKWFGGCGHVWVCIQSCGGYIAFLQIDNRAWNISHTCPSTRVRTTYPRQNFTSSLHKSGYECMVSCVYVSVPALKRFWCGKMYCTKHYSCKYKGFPFWPLVIYYEKFTLKYHLKYNVHRSILCASMNCGSSFNWLVLYVSLCKAVRNNHIQCFDTTIF